MNETAQDRRLGYMISPSLPHEDRNHDAGESLRQLMVRRLSASWKAVGRHALWKRTASVFCEQCGMWARMPLALEWACPTCGIDYVAETIIFEERAERTKRMARSAPGSSKRRGGSNDD